jgi:hypothetical protein
MLKVWITSSILILLGGCAALRQTQNEVFTREPGHRFLAGPQPILPEAKKDWQFALISEAAYRRSLSRENAEEHKAEVVKELAHRSASQEEIEACADVDVSLKKAGWKLWSGFPNAELEADLNKSNLRAEVWENDKFPAIVVAFGGTVFTSGEDWTSNLRWFIPSHDDEYTALVTRFSPAFLEEFAKQLASPGKAYLKTATLYSTGHSLGGGLAQQFAYSMPNSTESIRVSKVYAFDPSPVTGFIVFLNQFETSIKRALRSTGFMSAVKF